MKIKHCELISLILSVTRGEMLAHNSQQIYNPSYTKILGMLCYFREYSEIYQTVDIKVSCPPLHIVHLKMLAICHP